MNRLDFDTSGLVIFAKCEYIQEMFSRQMANGDFKKYYLCIVDGTLSKKSGIIDLPIARKKIVSLKDVLVLMVKPLLLITES